MKRKPMTRFVSSFFLLVFILGASLLTAGTHPLCKKTKKAKDPTLQAWEIEHSAWVEDWTNNLDTDSFIAALPRGVNTLHVFVGQLALVNGVATINGYTLDTPDSSSRKHASLKAPAGSGAFPNIAALTDFVTRCKAQGITVKLSVGGQAGTGFGDSWSVLTENNIPDFAKALISICTTTTADGVDFDEEMEDTTIAALAGKLAGTFKDLAPNLITSYCVYGGCDASGPWHATNTVFLQNAVTSQSWCAIDRVYVMTYYDQCPLVQNENFMTSWITWLSAQHGFSASRISAGVDPNDPTTSPSNGSFTTWIDAAASLGVGTAIWDQLGVNDYVANDWGTQVTSIYNAYSGVHWAYVGFEWLSYFSDNATAVR